MATREQAQERYRLLFEQMTQGVVYRDSSASILAVNPAAEKIIGIPGIHLLGQTSIDPQGKALRSDGTPFPPQEHPCRVALASGGEVRNIVMGLFNQREDGYRWVNVDAFPQFRPGEKKPFQVFSTFSDITESRQHEETAHYLAFFDSLTGLPNRRLLLDRLRQALVQAEQEGSLVGLAFLDLDHFKTINDTLGHASGDALLKAVAQRLRECVRASDTVARLGGDEFVLLLPSLLHADNAAAIAGKVLEVFAHPFQLGEREIYTSTSIGLALSPLDAEEGEDLLSCADMAMYRAKENGRNLCQFFAPRMSEEAVRKLTLQNELQRGLRRGELLLFFQEKVNLKSGAIIGLEALLRWDHPERGMLPPAEFLPLAEESGLIVTIGEWVLRAACAQGMAWQGMGLPPLRIAVNIADRQLHHGNLFTVVRRALEESGLSPSLLELEFREESLLKETGRAGETLAALRKLGVVCAMDDFGTGLSAIARVRSLPLDRLNIHHSLVHNFAAAEDAGLIRGIVGLAHDLRLQVIAEGVESEEQMSFLQEIGCDEVQGFHVRLPVSAGEMTELLRRRLP